MHCVELWWSDLRIGKDTDRAMRRFARNRNFEVFEELVPSVISVQGKLNQNYSRSFVWEGSFTERASSMLKEGTSG